MEIQEKAYAKLNLTLDVEKKRADGYHDLTMVMISLALCDDITLTPRTDGKVNIECNRSYLPRDRRNLAVRAVDEFYARLDKSGGADMKIFKRIPVGAGMAGGSTDAAAVLRALNRAEGNPFTAEELCAIALDIGSDVPYCVRGGTMLAKGRGEILTPLAELPECGILVCKPAFSISTAELFKCVDSRRQKTHPDTAGMISALEAGQTEEVARRMFNVFEDVLPRQYSEVGEIRSALLDAGALGAVMTGTGSAVFGLFTEETRMKKAHDSLSARYKECYITHAVTRLEID